MAESPRTPNLYQLRCGTASATYSTSGIDGRPHLSYDDGEDSWSFSGDEIRCETVEIGKLVTVTLETVPDLGSRSLTLLLPAIHLPEDGEEVLFRAPVVRTLERTSIGGPALVVGAVERYRVEIFHGAASQVVF